MEFAPVDYAEALELKRASIEVTLGGRSIAIPRARLGEHYILETILADVTRKSGPSAALRRYVERGAGIVLADMEPTLDELLAAYDAIRFLNAFRGTLVVLQAMAPHGGRPPAQEDYPNRTLATIVSHLAHAYGWSVDHILGLGPEEAICYLQEAIVIQHEEREFEWNINGPTDKQGKRIPYPALKWPRPRDAKGAGTRRPIPAMMMPQGLIIRPAQDARGRKE